MTIIDKICNNLIIIENFKNTTSIYFYIGKKTEQL